MSADLFPPDETMRRMGEVLLRSARKPGTFNLATGQNYRAPFLSEVELASRGYDAGTVERLKKEGMG